MIKNTPMYKLVYSAGRDICKGNKKPATEKLTKFYKSAVDNPTRNLLIKKKALDNAKRDVRNHNIGKYYMNEMKLVSESIKTLANQALFSINKNKEYKSALKEFNKVYQDLYPNTSKVRNKLIEQNRVRI